MVKTLVFALLLLALSACGSFATKVSQLRVGSTKSEVRSVMGQANYSKSEGNLDIWQYATVAGFGYCEYRQIWFWDGRVTSISGYNNVSIAGCSAGLRRVDWEAAMSEAERTYGKSMEQSTSSTLSGQASVADELIKLQNLHSSGALTDAEFAQAKRKVLGQSGD